MGQAVRGEFEGAKLEFIPALMTDWATWVELHPDTKALDKGDARRMTPTSPTIKAGGRVSLEKP